MTGEGARPAEGAEHTSARTRTGSSAPARRSRRWSAATACPRCGCTTRGRGAGRHPGGRARLARLRNATQGRPEDATCKERIRLGELLTKAIHKRKLADGKEILERLRPLAEALGLEPPEDELMVARVVFLLRRDRTGEFDLTLEELAQERNELMRFRLLGPMPAYNFIASQGPAWA